jgi:hypothetical protein
MNPVPGIKAQIISRNNLAIYILNKYLI